MTEGEDNSVDPVVHVYVHLVMRGTVPLQLGDLLFTDDALVIPEYEYLTPLGIARGGVRRASQAARDRYAEGGIEALVALADRTRRIEYEQIQWLRVHDNRMGRPKIAVGVREGVPYAYRIHAPVELDELVAALDSLGERRGFDVERQSTLGFSPRNSLRRFLANR